MLRTGRANCPSTELVKKAMEKWDANTAGKYGGMGRTCLILFYASLEACNVMLGTA